MSRLRDPELSWKNNNVPYSAAFGDVYYSTIDPVGETQHVFLDGIDAPNCWTGCAQFVIGETGFGTGLNFLATWDLWRKTRKPGSKLYYISVEGAPLAPDDLAKAHAPLPALAELSAQLISAYPVRHPGYHQVLLDGGEVELLLLFGPVDEMLEGLSAQVDAWYLDGFAPSRNADMWSPQVLAAISDCSGVGTRVATYSAARAVRDGLMAVGFDCEKVPGFARKRDSLKGLKTYQHTATSQTPWFSRSKPLERSARIAVVGAGISGACIASALHHAGLDVTVIDSHPEPAGEASGNPAGLIQPRPGGGNAAYERLQTSAYYHAVRAYDQFDAKSPVWLGQRGVLSFARDHEFLSRHHKWIAAGGLEGSHAKSVTQAEIKDIAGVDLQASGLWFPKAGTISPKAICQHLLAGVPALYGKSVSKLGKHGSGWRLFDEDQNVLIEVDAVVLANGFAASQICPGSDVPLYAKRGQISFMAATEQSMKLQVGLSYGGYATPAITATDAPYHILGATYQQWPDHQSLAWRDILDGDHDENLSHIDRRLPVLKGALNGSVIGGRATLRTTTTDHLPVVGPAFNTEAYNQDYADLRHGKPTHTYPQATYMDGVYMLSALGSRGFALAPLLARMLTAEILGTPMPVDKDVCNLVHPARFLVRQLKRR